MLRNAMIMGCSAAASPLITPVTFASVPSDNRLVVIILRGAMDGLDVVRPIGDRNYATYRDNIDTTGQTHLSGMFALHPGLANLAPLWDANELGFVHAVSTPYRDKRSHFDGQDLLEAGYANLHQYQSTSDPSGWLNRLLTLMPNVQSETAFAIGQEHLIMMQGDEKHSSWSPGRSLLMSQQGIGLLERVYETDPLFHASAQVAIELSAEGMDGIDMDDDGMMQQMMRQNLKSARLSTRSKELAKFAADQLKQDTRIAAFSIGGWDTHNNQKNTINKPLAELSRAILTLKAELGDVWEKTAVVCMTEFGRTVRQNGSMGTDHGTGGAMVLAGGAIKGGNVYGDWPGLRDSDLYKERDLLPTQDVRAIAAYVMRGLFGLSKTDLSGTVFPGLQLPKDPKIML
jgi:uncharacterized protein (DUF1501 family)